MSGNSVQFSSGKKKTRGELRLPNLHFIACDDWIPKIGQDAFVAWLKFYTWADRSNKNVENDIIPTSMNGVAKKLGVGKEKLYQKIIRPLWNYGFIDLTEFNADNGYTCTNVVVYEYPQNDPSLSAAELKQVRDYDKDWQSSARLKSLSTATKKRSTKPNRQFENRTTPSSEIELP